MITFDTQKSQEKVKPRFRIRKLCIKESKESLLTTARSVDTDLIDLIRETTIEANKQEMKEKQFLGRKKCCIVSLFDKLKKW